MTFIFRPFSHQPGISFLLPRSQLVCKIYPAKIVLFDMSRPTVRQVGECTFDFGPLVQFTAVQDLEKGHIQVSGFSKNGFIRYQLYAGCEPNSWGLRPLKGTFSREYIATPAPNTPWERLYLGSSKALRWPHIQERHSMHELLPLWYTLGQLSSAPVCTELSASLLGAVQEAVAKNQQVVPAFSDLYLAGFTAGFVPRLVDLDYQGFALPVVSKDVTNSLTLLTTGASLIRELFFSETEKTLSFLPKLPHEFHCGSLSDVETVSSHKISMEWSKKLIRLITFTPSCDDELTFFFQKEIKKFRVRTSRRDPGHYFDAESKLSFEKGKSYIIDRFQK